MCENRRKRVLLVIRHPVGGIRTYIQYIYSQAVFDEFDFSIITPDPDLKVFFEGIFNSRNLEYITCNNGKDMFRVLRNYVNTKDISLIHSHGFTAGGITALVSMRSHIPHLMTAHDVFQEKQFYGVKKRVKKWMLSTVFSRIDTIHTVSHDATNNLLMFFPMIKLDRIRCIPHGIDTDAFYNTDKTDIVIDYDKREVVLIGFFGRFMAQKGFRNLVDAVEIIVKDRLAVKTPLVLTFDWGGYVREEYEEIENRGLKKYFHMMEYTDNMPGMIKAMDMVVMPSLWESSGLLGMESLVAGTPIIGSSCIGLREVLAGSPAVMVEPNNSKALADAIVDEINTPRANEFKRYSSVARDRYSLQRPAAALKKLYVDMMFNK